MKRMLCVVLLLFVAGCGIDFSALDGCIGDCVNLPGGLVDDRQIDVQLEP